MGVRLLLLACVTLSAGCYSYQPSGLESVGPGDAIRLRISPEEADRLVDVRLTDDRVVDGVLLSNGERDLLLETTVGINDPQRGTRALTQRITIPTTEVRDVELRTLDMLKTGVAGGALAAGVGIVIAAALAGGGGQDGPPDNGGVELVVPRRFGLSFRLPFPGF